MKTAQQKPLIRKLLEELEQRIAPAALSGITYDAVTLGNPQVVEAGQGLSTVKDSGSFLLAVEKGAAMVFTTDLNGNNKFDPNEITGIAASDGLRITLFADVNGDIVTNLTKRFDSAANKSVWVLTDSDLDPSNNNPRIGGDGLVLLNSRIEAITLRSVTDADIAPQDASKGITAQDRLVLSSYSIHGNILAGGGVGAKNGGISIDTTGLTLQQEAYGQTDADFQLDSVLPIIGSIKTGTAAAPGATPAAPEGQFFSFGYKATGDDATRGRLTVGGYLEPFVPAIGQAGGDIINVTSLVPGTVFGQPSAAAKWRIDAIVAGDGGLGARGGNIENISLYGESGGLKIVAGDGGDGPSGGAGGSILNLQDFGSTNSVFEIRAGDGGRGLVGAAGAAGRVTFGAFDDGSALSGMRANGITYVGLGSGGAGFTSSGAGTSLSSGTVAPTDENGTDTSVGVFSSWRGIGEIPTQRMADFNRDGFTDVIYLTTNPDQIIMKFGTAAGITQNSPTLYFAAPAFAPMTGGTAVTTTGLAIADFNRDGWLDFAVGSSGANSFEGIRTYLNPGDQYRPDAQPASQPKYNGWYTAGFAETAASPESRAVGRNYIEHAILSPLPFLNPYANGAPIQRSGMPLTDLVAGNFDGDAGGVYDLAAILRIWKATRIDADRAWTSLVMLSGTDDGRFFADFEYDPAVGVQTQLRMPVLNGTTTGLNPVATGNGSAVFSEEHLDIALRSTAAPSHAPGGASAELMVGATLRFQDDKRVQTTQFSDVPGSSLVALQAIARENPRYFDPIIVTGSIVAWNSRTGTPVDITIADLPAVNTPTGIPPAPDGIFDILVVNQEKAVSMISPLYLDPNTGQPLPTNTGIVLTGQRGENPRVGGVPPDAKPGSGLRQPVEIFGDDVEFRAIVAGNFSTSPFLPTSFSLLSTGTGFTRDQFISFYFPGLLPPEVPDDPTLRLFDGDLWANLTYKPDGTFSAASARLDDGRLDANLVAFDLFSRRTNPVFFGVVEAIPTTLEGGFRGIINGGNTRGIVLAPNLINSLSLVAGDGGNSYFGSGGQGGSIGSGTLSTPAFGGAQTGSFTVLLPRNEYIQPARVIMQAGQGGDGFVNGGAGGGMSSVIVDFVPGVNSTLTSLFGGSGGDALLGSGGAGGSLSQLSIQRGINFQAGDGGSGNSGGAGGSLNGSGGVNGPDTFSRVVTAVGGDGGDGVLAGGRGGGLNAFVGLYQRTTGGDSGSLLYSAGRGGDAISGFGGSGGSILNSSPSTIENFIVGPIVLSAGAGGNGLGGGIGGSISNFTNASTTTSAPTIFSAVAGPGGAGVTRNGGAGGSVSNVSASANGVEADVSGQFNRLIAGDGGPGFGSTGGAGGSVTNSTATASASGAAAAAGNGGEGLLRGGAGGAVSKVVLDSTAEEYAAKIIVMAGHGGAAYAATATAPGVALPVGQTVQPPESAVILSLRAFGGANGVGGAGGSIVNFTQASDPSRPNSGGVDTAVDLLAGRGGSLMNYGSVALFPDRPNPVGAGGSVSNVTLAGEAGRSRPEVAILGYSSDFTERVLRNGWGTQLNDSLGNVGIVAGAAGEVKNGMAGDGPAKNGSVTNLTARSIMSIVAGSVDRIAAVKTLSGIAAPSTGILGAWKTNPIDHPSSTTLYFAADGVNLLSSPVLGGRLMDGALVTQANPNNLSSARLTIL